MKTATFSNQKVITEMMQARLMFNYMDKPHVRQMLEKTLLLSMLGCRTQNDKILVVQTMNEFYLRMNAMGFPVLNLANTFPEISMNYVEGEKKNEDTHEADKR